MFKNMQWMFLSIQFEESEVGKEISSVNGWRFFLPKYWMLG